MPYDQHLAERTRALLSEHDGVSERRMFGIAFKLGGHMVGGIVGADLIVRLGTDPAQGEPHVRPMDFTGRPLKGIFFVAPAGLTTEDELRCRLERAISFVRTLPKRPRPK